MNNSTIVVKVVNVNRRHGRIKGYTVEDNNGRVLELSSNKLKELVKKSKINIIGYKLTADNRLIKSASDDNKNCYYIMNKDNIVAKFDSRTYKIIDSVQLPYSCNSDDVLSWLKFRYKFTCARNAEEFFIALGLKNITDIIELFHCVSLQDTFWVKRCNSKLTWGNVSPFKHDYTEAISHYALEGKLHGLRGNKVKYFSPVVGTDGSFPHTWKRIGDDNIIFIKAGSKYTLGGMNSGREPYSEYYASQLGDFLKFNHVRYSIRNHIRQDGNKDVVTECKCFTNEKYGSVSAASLGLVSYEEIIEFCKKLNKQSYNTVIDMLFLDCLTLNTDRHFSNIEFIMNNESLRIEEVAPIYDNNYSLLPRFIEGMDVFDRGEYIVRDGRSFEELYALVKKNKNYNKQLISLKKFKFTKPEAVEISDKRLEFLNWFLQTQVEYLLKIK